MAVHMVRIHAEDPPDYSVSQIDAAVQDWVNNHTEWTADLVSHEITATASVESGDEWVSGDFRFESGDDKTILLDDAEAALQDYVSWYRLGYHTCYHDETPPQPCEWTDVREYNPGQIPDAVPVFL